MIDLNKIRQVCSEKGMTLKDLAKKSKISEMGLQRMLNSNSMKVATLEKIAIVLGVPLEKFFSDLGREPERPEFFFINIMDDELLSALSNRFKGFTEKISFYKDAYLWKAFQDLKYLEKAGLPIPYPEKDTEYLVSLKELLKIEQIPKRILMQPFSNWPKHYRKDIENFENLFEGFYFSLFIRNFLSVKDYMRDGLINDPEVVKYWNKWESIDDKMKELYLLA